jgi:hypothetical protein
MSRMHCRINIGVEVGNELSFYFYFSSSFPSPPAISPASVFTLNPFATLFTLLALAPHGTLQIYRSGSTSALPPRPPPAPMESSLHHLQVRARRMQKERTRRSWSLGPAREGSLSASHTHSQTPIHGRHQMRAATTSPLAHDPSQGRKPPPPDEDGW